MTPEELDVLATEISAVLYAQREEILAAFIAKYGCNPDEIEQIYETSGNQVRWYVRKMEKKNE